jgi:hypothetical protein
MIKLVFVLLFGLLILGCTKKNTPVQVNGVLKIGQYIISPPIGYWYFPKKHPLKHKMAKKDFLLTFCKDKESISKKDPTKIDCLINFGLFENKYKNYEDYYNNAKVAGISYDKLPDEADILKSNTNWSCMQTLQGPYAIECVSLRKDLVIISAFGFEKEKVLSHISLLQKMLESFKDTN